MPIQLNASDLSAIGTVLDALNDIWKDTITSDVVVQWPDAVPLTLGSTVIGYAKFNGDMEQWILEPRGNFPPPPEF